MIFVIHNWNPQTFKFTNQIFTVILTFLGPPPGMSVEEAITALFHHYCKPWKTTMGKSSAELTKDDSEKFLDHAGFVKMCKEAPGFPCCAIYFTLIHSM